MAKSRNYEKSRHCIDERIEQRRIETAHKRAVEADVALELAEEVETFDLEDSLQTDEEARLWVLTLPRPFTLLRLQETVHIEPEIRL